MSSGQQINMEKTEMTSSRNVSDAEMEALCSRMGVQRVTHHHKYLGLPTLIGRSKKHIFSTLVERVQQKCKGWKDRSLSKAGKEIMIKAVLQAIPAYTMNCFLLPQETIQSLERCMARFYWGSKDGQRKVHCVSWGAMTKRKEEGGIGCKELHYFNLAMLARQWWHLVTNPNTNIFKLLKSKYFPNHDIQNAALGYQPSFMWRSLLVSKNVVEEGTAWRVGNGENIKAVGDRWIGYPFPRKLEFLEGSEELKVADLINQQDGSWDSQLIRTAFPNEADDILAIPLSARKPPDLRVWGPARTGKFSVRSAYRVAALMNIDSSRDVAGPSEIGTQWKEMWSLKITPKISHFLWQACKESLPTLDNLCKRGIDVDPVCKLCGSAVESQNHLFLQCEVVKPIWKLCALRLENTDTMGSFRTLLWASLERRGKTFTSLIGVVAWSIWIARNKVCMEGDRWNMIDILGKINRIWCEMKEANCKTPKIRLRVEENDGLNWLPPPEGWLKFDTDVAVLSPTTIGMGVVGRNYDGQVIVAARKEVRAAGSSTLLEGLGVRFALRLMLESGLDYVMVGNDNSSLMQSVNGISSGEFEGVVVEDIRELAKSFTHIEFVYNRRELNMAAHHMARSIDGVYWNMVPSAIASYV